MQSIGGDTVLDRPQSVIVRPQKGNYLFYNSRTDELHLIPPTGYAAYVLCDGLKTVDEIGSDLSEAIEADPAAVRRHLIEFFVALESRGLVERADA